VTTPETVSDSSMGLRDIGRHSTARRQSGVETGRC
jgi:hypothetical protein